MSANSTLLSIQDLQVAYGNIRRIVGREVKTFALVTAEGDKFDVAPRVTA